MYLFIYFIFFWGGGWVLLLLSAQFNSFSISTMQDFFLAKGGLEVMSINSDSPYYSVFEFLLPYQTPASNVGPAGDGRVKKEEGGGGRIGGGGERRQGVTFGGLDFK